MSHSLHEERCVTSCSFLADSQQRKQKTLQLKHIIRNVFPLKRPHGRGSFKEHHVYLLKILTQGQERKMLRLWIAYCIVHCIQLLINEVVVEVGN